ncbi:MAG: hypothetical protein QM757_38475 [Paludibaculum sp.]
MKRLFLVSMMAAAAFAQPTRWSEKQANDWYAKQPWLVGANYNPANAINELEMWQKEIHSIRRASTWSWAGRRASA